MTTYSEQEWDDIRSTGTPGPRVTAVGRAVRPAAAEQAADEIPCEVCRHEAGWHTMSDPRECLFTLTTGPCPCGQFRALT